MKVDVLGVVRESLQRSLPLGAAIGLALSLVILIGWQDPISALAGLFAPPLLALALLPEVLARRRPASLERDVLAFQVAVVGGVLAAGLGFYEAGYAAYNLMYASGGSALSGRAWLHGALRNPNLDFLLLLITISMPLATLVPMRLRAVRLRYQWLALAFLAGAPLALLASRGRFVEAYRGVPGPFVDTYYYVPLCLGVCLVGPPLLAWGDRLHARWGGSEEPLLTAQDAQGQAEQAQHAADRGPLGPAQVEADPSAEAREAEGA